MSNFNIKINLFGNTYCCIYEVLNFVYKLACFLLEISGALH
jgi:hypothetical protein